MWYYLKWTIIMHKITVSQKQKSTQNDRIQSVLHKNDVTKWARREDLTDVDFSCQNPCVLQTKNRCFAWLTLVANADNLWNGFQAQKWLFTAALWCSDMVVI